MLSYGAEVWFDPEDKRVGRNKLIYPLQVIQNKCLRTVTGAYKSTSILVLEHEASVAPLDIHLEKLAVTHTLRSRNQQSGGAIAIANACTQAKAQAERKAGMRITASVRRSERLCNRILGIVDTAKAKTVTRKKANQDWANRWQEYQD